MPSEPLEFEALHEAGRAAPSGPPPAGRVVRESLPPTSPITGLHPDEQPYWPASPTGSPDFDILADVANRLDATGAFAEVRLNSPIDAGEVPAEDWAAAAVLPLEWEDTDRWGAPVVVEDGVCRLAVQIVVREQDDARRLLALGRLQEAVKAALNGRSLGAQAGGDPDGGLTAPGLTIVRRGRYDPAWKAPAQAVTLTVEYSRQFVE